MIFHCQKGVVLDHRGICLGQELASAFRSPSSTAKSRQAGSSPRRAAHLPADAWAKPLSLAAAGASFIAKVREPGVISPEHTHPSHRAQEEGEKPWGCRIRAGAPASPNLLHRARGADAS